MMEADTQAMLQQVKTDLLDGMREYMNDVTADGEDPGYTESDIGKCAAILDSFLGKLSTTKSEGSNAVMSAVKETVLALNVLNESCDGGLIETDQREQLCELIIQGAATAGVGSGEDITEEWRDW